METSKESRENILRTVERRSVLAELDEVAASWDFSLSVNQCSTGSWPSHQKSLLTVCQEPDRNFSVRISAETTAEGLILHIKIFLSTRKLSAR